MTAGEIPGRRRWPLTDTASGLVQVAGAVLTAPLLRRRYNRWGATADEVRSTMPGDALVPRPKLGYTRAITIRGSTADVWPWLVQMGQGRGGLYSFDGLENLVGCRMHSVMRIHRDLQDLRLGDLVRMGPEGYPCFRVGEIRAPTVLVLIGANPKTPHDISSDGDPGGVATWQWLLRPAGDGTSTRLIVRQRLSYSPRQSLIWHLVEPIAFVMERQMLRGIRRRAEAVVSDGEDPSRLG